MPDPKPGEEVIGPPQLATVPTGAEQKKLRIARRRMRVRLVEEVTAEALRELEAEEAYAAQKLRRAA